MRRIIHNTTAIAACLSLLVPQLVQAQVAAPPADRAAGGNPGAAPLVLAQAEPEQPPVRAGQAQPPEQAAAPKPKRAREQPPEAEPKPQRQRAEQGEPKPHRQRAEQAEQAAPQRAERQPRPERQRPEADPSVERPAQAAREQQRQRPADSAEGRAAQQEEKPQRARERAARQSAEEEATQRGQAERPEEPARRQNRDRPEQAARQQNQDRPAEAGREQQADQDAPRRQQGASAPEPREERRPQRAGSDDPREEAPDRKRQAGQPPASGAGDAPPRRQAAPAPRDTPDEQALKERLERDQQQSNVTAEGQGRPQRAGERARQQARPNEAARQAAQETRAANAAALNEDSKGEVVEQRITKENSRSSDEDFSTSLRDALEPRARQARNNDNDDNDNDLAKALLLGLGAVAVGTYLNNNRQVALSAPDRVVVTRPDGSQELIKDDTALLRQPGSTVATENFDDGSSRTVVTRPDGSRVVTIRDADLRVLRRTLVSPDGTQTQLIDDTATVEPVDIATLPAPAPVASPGIYQDEAALREALRREVDIDRRFTLGQVRSIPEVRALVAPVNIDAITFDTGSAAISPDQARQLSTLGAVIQDAIAENPREVFLIEGHTDLVGSEAANLALSDRRAESVALALSEYFQVPPENLVVQGYGEQFPQVLRDGDVRENRRAAVRRITDLLQTAEAQ